jgi:hypothetical protein
VDHAERRLRALPEDRLEPPVIDREHPNGTARDEAGDPRLVGHDRLSPTTSPEDLTASSR